MSVDLDAEAILSDLTLPISLPPDLLEQLKYLKSRYAYSYRLLLTYHATLVALIAVFWLQRSVSTRSLRSRPLAGQSNDKEKHTIWAQWLPKAFFSGSNLNNELSPLLPPVEDRFGRRTIWASWRSMMMYEPKPLPLFNRAMPSNATSFLVIGLLGINVFYLLFSIKFGDFGTMSLIGNRASCLFIANLPWLYLLAAKHHPIQRLTGYSYENLNILHRRLGEWLCFLAILHFLGMFASWYNFLRPFGLTLSQFLTIRFIFFGIVALLCYETMYITSLAAFRAWWYEMFLGCHIILQAAALVLLFLHHHMGRPYITITLAIFVFDRMLLRFGTKTRSFQADLTILEDGRTVLLSVDWPLPTSSKRPRTDRSVRYGWQPSEHVFVTIPALGRKHHLQAHPFTIASAAPMKGATHLWLNLLVRAQTGFSNDLLRYAHAHSSTLMRLDGPYGSSHALDTLQHSDLRIIIAGGSGIAVAYPLLSHCLPEGADEVVTKGQVHLIWIVQDALHLSWVGHERLEELRTRGLHVMIPPPTRKCGRPNVRTMIQHCIQDGLTPNTVNPRIGVVVSGPDPLNRSVRNTCSTLVREGMNIDIVVEKYGW